MTKLPSIAAAFVVLLPLSLACGVEPPKDARAIDGAEGTPSDPADAGAGDAPAADQAVQSSPDQRVDALFVPYVAGSFSRVYVPSGGRYLNDHTVARGPDGLWHVYGISNTGPGTPSQERAFLHATSQSLFGTWSDQPDALVASDAHNEAVIWAPHVLETAPGRWTMFFFFGPVRPESPIRLLRRAESMDLRTWTRVEGASNPLERPPGGRDPFLFRDGQRWLLFSVGVRQGHGQIVVTSNEGSDLGRGWSNESVVIEDPVPSFEWGNLESPFIVPLAGHYYLFLTRTGAEAPTDYNLTLVFRSTDPRVFAWQPIGELRAHAAEIVQDGAEYYLTSCGWPSAIGDKNRGLSIAPLRWARQ